MGEETESWKVASEIERNLAVALYQTFYEYDSDMCYTTDFSPDVYKAIVMDGSFVHIDGSFDFVKLAKSLLKRMVEQGLMQLT